VLLVGSAEERMHPRPKGFRMVAGGDYACHCLGAP
jgi:hypothetical protein